MKLKIAFLLLFFQMGFSQIEKSIKGTVLSDNFPKVQVDVVNFNSKTSTTTDVEGKFEIRAKQGDSLIFIAKDFYLKKVVVTVQLLQNPNNKVNLVLKPTELKEVLIVKMPSIGLSKDKNFEQGKLDELAMGKRQQTFKNPYVYDGQTPGIDFIRLASMIGTLFAKESKPVKVKVPLVGFKDVIKLKFESDLYAKTLNLKEEEIGLFLEFCDADPKSKELVKNSNPLSILDFLIKKNEEFKKL